MKDNFDDLVNNLLSKTLFEAPAAPVEEPEVEPDIKPDTKPLPTPSPQKPLVPKRHPLQPTRPDVKPRPQATDKGPISPDVAAFINARK
jgi:hypothetical protein